MRLALALGGVALIALGERALAQPADPRQRHSGYIGQGPLQLEIDDCPPVPDVPTAELERRGAEHYERGEVLYAQGDYPNAVSELVSSYCLFPGYYNLLKDIGQAYERSLDYERAIAYLERYVIAIPKDAKRANACAPDPQDDRRYVSFRIETMRKLPARILVDTTPGGAKITLSNDAGIAGRATSGEPFGVRGGRYEMKIERDGYKTITRDITALIGRPYTFFERLEPLTGRLRVTVIPADARIFVDDQQVGIGTYEAERAGGAYKVTAEAKDRLTLSRRIVVLPEHDTPVSIELVAVPQFGRRQLIAYAALAGGVAGGAMLSSVTGNNLTLGGPGVLGGAAAGLFGTYYGLGNTPLGTSDLAITSSLIGAVAGAAGATLFTRNQSIIVPVGGAALVAGGMIGYYVGDRLRVRPGEAALVNSGAVWGTTAGFLFVGSFNPGSRVGAGIALSGLGMGATAGVLLSRYYTISRAHAALIDVGGVIGMIVGVAAENLIYRQVQNSAIPTDTQREHTSNFALGGLALGLIASGYFTRNMDDVSTGLRPAIGATSASDGKSTMTYGVTGAF